MDSQIIYNIITHTAHSFEIPSFCPLPPALPPPLCCHQTEDFFRFFLEKDTGQVINWVCPTCKIMEDNTPLLVWLEVLLLLIYGWPLIPAVGDKEGLWCCICVSGMHRDWLVQQEGSISVTVIRNLMWRGSRENRVSPLSDTFMKERDISSGHVSASLHSCSCSRAPLSNMLSTTSHTYRTIFKLHRHTNDVT